MRPLEPPPAAVRMLARRLPAHEREELIGDLAEEFLVRASRAPRSARAWYWAQTVGLILARGRLSRAGAEIIEDGAPRLWADAGTDWRLAWRSLSRSPGFVLVALASMVLSLGLATAVFSILNTVLLHPLPGADRVVRLGAVRPDGDFGRQTRVAAVGALPPPPSLSDTMVGAWLARRRTIGAMTTYSVFPQTVVLNDEPMRLGVADVGPEFFDVFPVSPRAGRTLASADGDRTRPLVAVISERVVRQRVADPGTLIGRHIKIDARQFEIVGVLPVEFEWPDRNTDVWAVDRTVWPAPGVERNFGRSTAALGVMRAEVALDDVQREGQQLADEIEGLAPDARGFGPPRVIVRALGDELLAPIWPALMLLTAGTVGVVVAANVNLAGFLMARNTARHRDLAVRRALGASNWRIVRPVLFEQLLLAGGGAAGAVVFGWWVLKSLPLVAPPDLPRLAAVGLDASSFAFAWLTAALTALIVGLMPTRRLPRASLREIAGEGGIAVSDTSRRGERFRSVLVMAQVSVATLLLVGSILVGRSLIAMLRIDTGYRPEGVLTFQIGLARDALTQPGRAWSFYSTLQSRLLAQPSVTGVGISSALPLHGDTLRSTMNIPGLTPPRLPGVPAKSTHIEHVNASYLQTLGATLTRGRFFTDADAIGAEPLTIVNEAFAQAFLPGVDPLGQIVPSGVWRYRIVGVIAPIKRAASTVADDPAFYSLLTPSRERLLGGGIALGLAVRTSGDPDALVPMVRAIVRELEPTAPVYNMMSLADRVGRTFAQPRFFAVALALFAALSLVTALVGVYGVLSASIERRRIELGVRRALGATTADLVRLVLRRAFTLAGVGLVIGAALAAAAAAAGRSTLYGIAPLDGVSYLAAAVAILIVVVVGAWAPIRRGLRVDPARVLKAE